MALKISELTKKEQEAILKDKNLVPCSNCGKETGRRPDGLLLP